MTQPLVSVLIRSMDRPALDRALESAARQTWSNLEILVAAACGSSHRALPTEVGGRPLTLLVAPNGERLDRPRAANLLLASVRGEWFNFLDDDDEFLPQHIETLLSAPRRAEERVLYAQSIVHDARGVDCGTSGRAGFHAQLCFQNRSTLNATMFHRSLLDEGVRFDPEFAVYEDRDFMINCATRSPFRYVDAKTSIWHAHAGESGLGHGGNQQTELEQRYLPRLNEKWKVPFSKWMAAPESQIFLGQHMLNHQGPNEALPYLQEALRRAPNDVNALNLCGVAYLRLGDYARAQALMLLALERVPGHPALLDNLRLIEAGLAKP